MRKVILLLIACLLILLPSQAFAGEFSDTKGHWALQAINECAAVGIVKGYPDITFKPQNTVTHLEAISMIVKSLGLEQQAKELDLKNGNYNFPDGVTWGKEYIALAADKAIINKEKMANLKPNAPTTRAEIAVMFANALHLSGDASDLTFADSDQITEVFRSSVAGIVKNGIMVGQPGNKFAPGNTVTRAETVTIISRLFEKGFINPNPSSFFINKLSGIDKTNQLIAVQKSESATHPYIIANECLIYRDGKKAVLADFQENDNVKIVLDDKGRVKYLAHITGEIPVKQEPSDNNNQNDNQSNDQNDQLPPTSSLSGILNQVIAGSPVKAIITQNSGVPTLYIFDQAINITQGGSAKAITALVEGSTIEFDLTEGKITAIRILTTSVPSGDKEVIKKAYVINTSVDYLNLHYEDGEEKDYDIDYTVSFYKGNEAISLSSLQRGDPVEVKKYQNQSRLLSVKLISGQRKVFGEIVSNSYGSITIKDSDDKEYTYDMDEDVEITNNDNVSIERKDLEDGDDVVIVLDNNNIATEIKIDSNSLTVSGTIVSVDTSGDYSLVLDRSSGADRKYSVNDDVVVKKGTSSLDYDELSEDDEVELYLDSDGSVGKIVLKSDSSTVIKGEVTDIDDQGSYSITIEKSNGKKVKYDVDEDVDVKEGSKSRDFSDISEGDNVELSIDDDVVTDIEITDEDSSSASGIITDFDWDDEEITLEDDGDETDYELDEDTEITKDGDEIDPEDLVIGAEVELEIEDDIVVEISVEDDEDIELEGEIIKVYDDSVKIEQSSGNQFKYYFKDSASLEDEDGDDIDIDDLEEGMDVQIELRDGEIYTLEVN